MKMFNERVHVLRCKREGPQTLFLGMGKGSQTAEFSYIFYFCTPRSSMPLWTRTFESLETMCTYLSAILFTQPIESTQPLGLLFLNREGRGMHCGMSVGKGRGMANNEGDTLKGLGK